MTKKSSNLALRVWHWSMLAAGLGFIAWYHLAGRADGMRLEPDLIELAAVFAEVNSTASSQPVFHYPGTVDAGGGLVAAAGAPTAMIPPVVKGYADQINLLVVVDRTGIIRGVKLIDHRETASYMRRVLDAGFLESLIGRKAGSEMEDVDAVTGASITAKAIKDDVRLASAELASEVFGVRHIPAEVEDRFAAVADPRFIAVALALAVALWARFARWRAGEVRIAAWVLSIILIGVYAMTPYTLAHTFQLLKLNLPGANNALMILLAGFVIATTFLLGPVWCSNACPMGALQEMLSRLPIKRWRVTPRLISRAREIRYVALLAAVIGVFGLGIEAFSEIEPRGHLFARTRVPAAWLLISAVLLSSVFVKRFWCRFFCPTGACLVILSAHRKYIDSVRRGLDQSGIDRHDHDEEQSLPG